MHQLHMFGGGPTPPPPGHECPMCRPAALARPLCRTHPLRGTRQPQDAPAAAVWPTPTRHAEQYCICWFH